MPDILTTHAVVDDALESFREVFGPDAVRYRNHVYRGLNYQRKLLQLTKIQTRSHSRGLCTTSESGHQDGNYIPPSLKQVDELAPRYRIARVDRVRQMVEWHHKVRPYPDDWVETFRVADRIDVTRGRLRSALTRSEIRRAVNTFPYIGFHALLVRTGAVWAAFHPCGHSRCFVGSEACRRPSS